MDSEGRTCPAFYPVQQASRSVADFCLHHDAQHVYRWRIELFWASDNRTAALTFLKSRAWALDKPDSVKNNRSVASTPAVNATWAFADFPMAHDPTTSSSVNPLMHFRLWGVQEYTINLTGFGDLRQVFGPGQPANIPTPGPLQAGGLFDAGLKHVQGTQATWNGWRDRIGQIANGIDSNSSSSSVRSLRTNLLALKNSWLVSNLGIIGVGVGLIDFFLTGGRSAKPETPAPMNFLLNFTLTGSMRTQHQIAGGVTLPVPGGLHTGQPAVPTDLIYTQPTGIFNLRNTTILQGRSYWQPIGPGQSTLFRSYRVKEDLAFDINPTSELQLQSIEAALVYHVYPGWESFFLNWADQGLVELESANNGKYVFRSPYVDAHWFRFQRINVSLSTDVTIKIKAVFNRLNAPPGTQPVVFVGTYEPVFEPADSTGQPWPPAPQGITINTTRQYEFDPSEQAPVQYGYVGVQTNVSTASQMTVGGKDYRFYRWSDGVTQNPRSVTPSGNLSFTALYKAHMTSVSASAISGGGQRKIIRTGPQTYFACYESGGHVWLSRSTDGGQNWANEVRMSDDISGFTNRSPAISMSFLSPARVLVAWEAFGYSLGNYQNRIYIRAIDPNAFATVEHKTIITVQAPYPFTAMPVLAASNALSTSPTLLAYYDPVALYIKGHIIDYAINGNLFYGGVGSLAIAPNDFGYPHQWSVPTWHLAWSDGNTIYRGYCQRQTNQGGGWILVPSSPTVFVPSNSGTGVGELSMVRIRDAGAGHYGVSWTDNGLPSGPIQGSSSTIRFREYYGGPITIWPDVWGSIASPSLTHNYETSSLAVVWQGGSSVQLAQRLGSMWFPTVSLGSGATPTVSVPQWGATGGSNDIVLSRGTSGPPYAIQRTQISYGTAQEEDKPIAEKGLGEARFDPAGREPAPEGRGGYIEFPNGSTHIVLLEAKLGRNPLRFPILKDSMNVTNERQIDSAATTLPLAGVGVLEATILYRTRGIVPSAAQVALDVKDHASGELLERIRIFRNAGDTVMSLQVPLNYPGRSITVGLTSTSMNVAKRFVLEQWLISDDEQTAPGFPLSKSGEASDLPTTFAMHQNYPNPFNPTTTIKFDLPEGGKVMLAVYDVVGREIVRLADGVYNAGYHSVTWDASRQSSGVYFARLTSNDVGGNPRFSKLSKLLLIK